MLRRLNLVPFHPDAIYVLTEFDVQMLTKSGDNTWQIRKISNFRTASVIELDANTLLIGTEEDGLKKVMNDQLSTEQDVSIDFGLSSDEHNNLKFVRINKDEIYAYNPQGLYKLQNNQLEINSISGLDIILNKEILIELVQGSNGLLFGYTYSKLLYQAENKSWRSVDLSPYMRGTIRTIEPIENEIKLSSNGMIISYITDQLIDSKLPEFELIITGVRFKGKQSEQNLALNSPQVFSYIQDSGSISIDYVLTDIKNQDKIQYRYRLLGIEGIWQSYVDKNQVNFDHLPAGDYSFEVQARNSLNKVYTSKAYRFIVKPHWYLTLYAKSLWVFLTVLSIYLLLLLFIKWRGKIHQAQKVALEKVIFNKTIELKKLNFNLQKMAHQDGLTGLSNRLYLDEYIESLLTKDIKKLTVIMMDMDNFKKYNDENGHVAGDELLKELSKHLKKYMETEGNIVARYGGEEFVAILIGCHIDNVIEKSEAIRKSIENKRRNTSISIGISELKGNTNLKNSDEIYHLIDQADKALYQAKDEGRNRVCVFAD